MSSARPPLLPTSSRRVVAFGLLRSLGATVVLIGVYYVLPLDRLSRIPLGILLTVGLLVLAATMVIEVRATVRAPYPGVRAIEALASTVPVFVLLFAATYFVMSEAASDNFNVHGLTRTGALYFTVTVFATVGFGDIVATSQTARALVTAQMILDLVVLGLAVRVFIGAAQLARRTNARSAPGRQQPGG